MNSVGYISGYMHKDANLLQPILDRLQGGAKKEQQRHRTLDTQILRARMRANRSPSTVDTPQQAQKFLDIVRRRPKGELYKREIPLARKAQELTPPPRQADPRRSLIEHQENQLPGQMRQARDVVGKMPIPRIRPQSASGQPPKYGQVGSPRHLPTLPTTSPAPPNPKKLPVATQR